MNPAESLSRDNAAQMVWNAMQAKEVEYNYTLATENGQLVSKVTVEDKAITLLQDKYDGLVVETTLNAVSYNKDKAEWTYTVADNLNPLAGGSDNDFTVADDYCALYKHAVKVVYTVKNNGNVDEVLGVIENADVVVSGVIDDIDQIATATSGIDEITIDDVDYKLEVIGSAGSYTDVPVYAYLADGSATVAALPTNEAAYFEAIDNDDDARIDCIVYFPFTVEQIDYLSASSITLSITGAQDLEDINLYDGAEEDDWTVVTDDANANDDAITVEPAEIISGEITANKTSSGTVTDVKVDGTWYSVISSGYTGDTLQLNTEYDLVVVNGFVFHGEKTSSVVNADNILYVEKAGALSSGISDGVEAKVYFADNTYATVKVTEWNENDIVSDSATPGANEVKATPAATAMLKKLCTYTEKDGEYALELVNASNKGGYDSYETSTSQVVDGKIGTVRFADDAVVFVHDKDGVKLVSGATVSSWKDTTTVTNFIGLADKSNGVSYTQIGAIAMTGTAKSDMAAYGFVTSKISNEKIDNTNYLSFTMWDGTEEIEVIVENTGTAASVAQYDFIRFDWADADSNEADADDFVCKTASLNAVAITGFDSNSISFNNAAEIDFADEYAVIGVDTKNGKGVGARLTAAKDCQAAGHGSDQYANAVYFLNDEGDVEAVFVDTNGMMYSDKNGSKLCTGRLTTPSTSTSNPDSGAGAYTANVAVNATDVILSGMTNVTDEKNTTLNGSFWNADNSSALANNKLTSVTLNIAVSNDEYAQTAGGFGIKQTNTALKAWSDFSSGVKEKNTYTQSDISGSAGSYVLTLTILVVDDGKPITISFDFNKDGTYDRTVTVDTSNVSFS